MKKFALAIHGGAGTILRSAMTEEKEKAHHAVLEKSLIAGEKILSTGGSALDAVEASVKIMEDSELFNAGKGSVFTHEGDHEMDASIMDGKSRKAGAVAGVSRIKNPISLCKEILLNCDHVFLIGEGAEKFAAEQHLEFEPKAYFSTDFRRDQLLKIRNSRKTQLDHSEEESKKFGTVGAVALDQEGNLASATSTGGITNKRYQRVGDTCIIGAGTYAENGVCAISATGWGEYFIRSVAAYDIAAMMKYGSFDLKSASEKLIHEVIPALGGDGGVIAVDNRGNIHMPFNTPGMYRGRVSPEGRYTAIYR